MLAFLLRQAPLHTRQQADATGLEEQDGILRRAHMAVVGLHWEGSRRRRVDCIECRMPSVGERWGNGEDGGLEKCSYRYVQALTPESLL